MELARLFESATDHVGREIRVEEGYSGRGMFGQETVAVVVDSVPQLLMDTVQYIKDRLASADGDLSEIDAFVDELPDTSEMGALRTDNMGYRTIVY